MSYQQELNLAYQKAMSAFLSSYEYSDLKLAKSIDDYMRACALYLWNAYSVSATDCAESVNSVYSIDAVKISFSKEQVQTALVKMDGKQYQMPVPSFFKKIINTDINDNTNNSRKLISVFKLMFLAFSLVDGKVEYKEAISISDMIQILEHECDTCGVQPFDDDIDIYEYASNALAEKDYTPVVTTGVEEIAHRQEKQEVKKNHAQVKKEKAPKKSSSTQKAIKDLDKLVGLSAAKKELREICNFASIQQIRKARGLPTSNISYHLVFTGNPGTGKTTVARIVAKVYRELGLLSKGHLVEASAKDLVAGYVGQTAIKTGELIEKALGGILFIDEAYALVDKNGQGYGQEAIDTLLKEMEDKREDFAVIVAGYDKPMKQFINSNPGLKSRFNRFVHFDDYTASEMLDIFKSLCKNNGYKLDKKAERLIEDHFTVICNSHGDDFANARSARNLFESIISKQVTRIAATQAADDEILSLISPEDVSSCISGGLTKDETLDDILAELHELIGLEYVKEEISDLVKVVQHQQRRKEKGLKTPLLSLHLVFLGNPGTGKTTVARFIARIYKALGLLSSGHLIETDRSGMVAGYVGQTAIKTQKIINDALGGVLFIDEAYSLSNGSHNDYGQEAIDTLLKAMEDKRDNFVVIVAGYPDEMDSFIHSNPGLESRFNRHIHFEDYSPKEMVEIFCLLCRKNQYELSEDGKKKLHEYFSAIDISEIANGRGARNLFEKVVTQQAIRMNAVDGDQSGKDLSTIILEDIENALQKEGSNYG